MLKLIIRHLVSIVLSMLAYISVFWLCTSVTIQQYGEYRLGYETILPPIVFMLTYGITQIRAKGKTPASVRALTRAHELKKAS